jgi:hypothetical protein
MQQCRQEYSHHMLARCTNDNCRKQTYIPHSCGHRSCPHCQNHEGWQWIENQLKKQLPAQYFLITFTLLRQLRQLVFWNQQLIYFLMFLCVQETLKTFTLNDKQLQGLAGFTAVLHTHSRRLDSHPHIHVVMPAASINCKTRFWRVKSAKYIFNHKNLAKVFRAKLLERVGDNGLQVPLTCPKKCVVDCKNVGNGDKALIYLGRYLYKGVIQEKDIIRCDKGMIIFSHSCLYQADFQKDIFYNRVPLPDLSNKRFRLWLAPLSQSNLICYVHPLDDFLYMKCVNYHK